MKEEKVGFHKKKWFAILMLVLIAPIGIALIWTNKHFEKKTNVILTTVFTIWFVIVVVSGQTDEVEKDESEVAAEKVEIKEEKKETAKVEKEPELTEEEKAEIETKKKEEVKKAEEEKIKAQEEREVAEATKKKEEEESMIVDGFSVSQKNAIRQAEQYIGYTAFSKSGLVTQLEFEGYSNEESTVAVEHIDVDWKDQAVKKAEQYMEYTAFSRSGLIQQLTFEGYSQADADYAATQVGL